MDLSPEAIADYDTWRTQAHDAELPVFGSTWLLLTVSGVPAVLAALAALVLVVLGMVAGTLRWAYEHNQESPGHTA